MKRIMRILSVLILIALLGLPALSAAEIQATITRDRVIGDSLSAAYVEKSGAEQSVMIFIEDIAHNEEKRGLPEADPAARTLSSAVEEYKNQAEIEAVQADIMARRAASRKAYLAQNTAFAEKYLDGKVEYISKYSPVIIATLDSVEANQLALKREVESIELYEMELAEEEPMTAPLANYNYTDEDIADYYNMVHAGYMITTYDGSGINIGILEPGVPYSQYCGQLGFDPDPNNNNEHGNCFNPEECVPTKHCTLISLIIHRLAPNANLFWGQIDSRSDSDRIPHVNYVNSLEWMLSRGINIICISRDLEGLGNYSVYDSNAKYLDYISKYSSVTIVKASGNVGSTGMTSGGMSYNSIVVGGTNADGVWADYPSDGVHDPGAPSYNSMFTYYATKPDVSAPASVIRYDSIDDWGTSYAAPQVAALAARLMQVDPDLMYYPDATKAIIMTNVSSAYGANVTAPISSTNSYTKLGAGIIDCSRAIHSTRGGGYEVLAFSPNSSGTNDEIQVTLTANSTVRITLVSLINISRSEVDSSTNASVPRLLMNVYYGSEYITTSYDASSYHYYNNAKIITFTATKTGTYTIRIRNNSNFAEYIYYAIAWDS